MKNKVYRIKIYRRQSGPFEGVFTARTRKAAYSAAVRKSGLAAKEFFLRYAHELSAPGLDKPDIEVVVGGTVYHMPKPAIGQPAYTTKFKLTKIKPINKGRNEVVSKTITLIGFSNGH